VLAAALSPESLDPPRPNRSIGVGNIAALEFVCNRIKKYPTIKLIIPVGMFSTQNKCTV